MDILNQSSRGASSHIVIDTLAWLIEDAFEGDPSHSLLANLHDLREEDWTTLPRGVAAPLPIFSSMLAGLNGCMKTTPSVLPLCEVTSRPSSPLEALAPS